MRRKKGDFKKYDLCVYFEIDSFLPIGTHFDFLQDSSYKKTDIMGKGYLLKTMKFRGQYSQGLVMPLSEFPEIDQDKTEEELLGMDVTDLLGIKKYEIEERATGSGTIIGQKPSFIPTTDETRVQSEPGLITELFGKPYYMSTKMDGSSHSIGIDEEGTAHICGHHYEYADNGKSSFYEYVKKNRYAENMKMWMAAHPEAKTFVIQGEWCGPGLQGNPIGLARPHWFVFTVIINGKRLGISPDVHEDFRYIAHTLEMETVPIAETGDSFPYKTPEELLGKADGIYEKFDGSKQDRPREGLVIRPQVPVQSQVTGTWLSMKAVSNQYLAKKSKKG